MFELLIDKVIGEDWWRKITGVSEEISARAVRERLSAFPDGETEMRIVIDSPGGDVFEGITIFNIIRDFARNRPGVKITTYIQGMAASMASVIALAANSVDAENPVIAEDNAVFMIHDAWDVAYGNRNELREAADFLEQIDGVLRAAYVRRTGKSDGEISAMMDAETWFWGNEIKDAGFADFIADMTQDEETQKDIAKGIVSAVAPADKNESILSAKAKFTGAKKTMQQVHAHAKKGEERSWGAAAMALGFTTLESSLNTEKTAKAVEDTERRASMTVEELKKDSPAVYDAILVEGKKLGEEAAQARAARLLQLGEKAGAVDAAIKCFREGKDTNDSDVVDFIFDRGAAAKALATQKADGDVPEVNTPKNDKNADLNAVMAAFDRETGADKWEK